MRKLVTFAIFLHSLLPESQLKAGLEETGKTRRYPQTMALIGDSRGVGVFADTARGSKINLLQKLRMEAVGHTLRRWYRSSRPSPMDTLSQSFRAMRLLENWHLNAFTGSMPYSHRRRIEVASKRQIRAYNASLGAGNLGSIMQLVKHAVTRATIDRVKIDYWVVDLGPVDFIRGTSAEDVGKGYMEGFSAIYNHNPRARILVTGLPPMLKIQRFGNEVAYHFFRSETCREVWDRLSLGKALLYEDQNIVSQRWQDYSRTVGNLVSQYTDRNMIFAKYPDTFALENRALAADCYHPNENGNRLASDATWPKAEKLFEN